MNSKDWQLAERIYLEVSSLEPGERASRLDQAFGIQ